MINLNLSWLQLLAAILLQVEFSFLCSTNPEDEAHISLLTHKCFFKSKNIFLCKQQATAQQRVG